MKKVLLTLALLALPLVAFAGADKADGLYLFGSDISVGQSVLGDMVLVGESINVVPGTEVGGEAYIIGKDVSFSGNVTGDVALFAGESLSIDPSTVILGNLKYSGPEEIVFSEGMVAGEISYESPGVGGVEGVAVGAGLAGVFIGVLAVFAMLWLMGALITAVILVLALPRFSLDYVKTTMSGFWRNALIGLLVLIIAPFAITLLFVSGIGWVLSLLLIVAFAATMLMASIYSGIIFGSWVFSKFGKERGLEVNWWIAVIGIVLLFFARFIPVVGALLGLIFMLASIGGLLKWKWSKIKNLR